MTSSRATRVLRVGDRRIEVEGPVELLDRALGPLARLALERHEATSGPPIAVVVESGGPSFRVAATDPAPGGARGAPSLRETRWVAGDVPRVEFDGVGVASLPRDGPMRVAIADDAPEGDVVAERVTIPALAERLRREGVRIVHAACLVPPDRRGAWLVPAARGSGKTTLSLSLARAGWAMLSDDRGFLVGTPKDARIDPWPEAPRVGDRSLFLLPLHVAVGPRDRATGKALAPSLLPPRVPAPLPIAGFFFPTLVEGSGGDVVPVRGAAPLAILASQTVVATDPATAAQALLFVAALLASRPAFEVAVGDDPAALAAGVAAAI